MSSHLFQKKVQSIFDFDKDRDDGSSIGGVINTLCILLFVGAAYLFYTHNNKKKQDSKDNKPWVTVPGRRPIVGHFHQIKSPDYLVDKTTEWAKLYSGKKGGCYEFYIFGDRTIAICSQTALEEIMKYRPTKIYRANQLREAAISIGFNGKFRAEGTQWKQEHKLVAAALNKSNVQDYLLVLKEMTARIITKWSNEIDVDDDSDSILQKKIVDDDLGYISADAISKSIMGKDLDFLGVLQQQQKQQNQEEVKGNHHNATNTTAASKDDFLHLLSGMVFRILMPIWYWRIPIVGQYLDGMGSSINRVYNLVDGIVEEYEKDQQQQQDDTTTGGSSNPKSSSSSSSNDTSTTTTTTRTFLQKLYEIMNSEGGGKSTLTRDRVVGNIITLFMAGTDTTSNTVALSLWLLAKDQELQKQLRLEADEFDASTTTMSLSLADLYTKLPRLKSFLQEVHRCYGVPIVTLEPTEDIPFQGTTLQKGTSIYVCTQYIAMNDDDDGISTNKNKGNDTTTHKKHPPPKSEFCPTRFLVKVSSKGEGQGKGKGDFLTCRPPNVQAGESLGFGFGVRSCPGRIYTEAFSYLLLNSMLRNFEWELPPSQTEAHLIWNVTISPEGGVSLRLSKRTNKNLQQNL